MKISPTKVVRNNPGRGVVSVERYAKNNEISSGLPVRFEVLKEVSELVSYKNKNLKNKNI